MEEKVGSYIIGADGSLIPNDKDEPMAERHGLEKLPIKKKKDKEVNPDAGN